MALDATARETNFRDSIREYLYTKLKNTEGYSVYFRQHFTSLQIREDKSIEKWVVVSFGDMDPGIMSEALFEIRPCTRNDPSYFKLCQMRDKILGYLTPGSGDGILRIPFYQSAEARDDWVLIGGILVHHVSVSRDLTAEDGTNFRVISVNVRFASKL